ncbi:MAG: hypothetical protein AB8B64_10495 [Granulosicoccus sp.]
MKLITDGVLPKLATIMLSTLVCVACNSEPEVDSEAEAESLSETVMLEEEVPSQADTSDTCVLDVPGTKVDVSTLDTSNSLLDIFGGECELKNIVLASAASVRRSYVNNNLCTFEEEMESNFSRPPSVLGKLLVQDKDDLAESAKRQLARSICEDASIMKWSVEEFLKSAELRVLSIGTATYSDENCPAIVWSQKDDEQGQLFHVIGPGKCTEIELPNSQFFNPETNPDGQLPGDYIRRELGFAGNLPSHYDIKGGSFKFESSAPLSHDDDAQLDRSPFGDDDERYITWSSGDENIDNKYMSSDEAFTHQYQLDELKGMAPRERALTALQRSYGAPIMGLVGQVTDRPQADVQAMVTTSSGDRFVMNVEPSDGVSESELLNWLPNAKPQLLVVQKTDEGSNDYLSLESAFFTDGIHTVSAHLESCDCDTQGFLGWLSSDKQTYSELTEKLRKDFIARDRSTTRFKAWTFTNEMGPRAVSYSLSRYDNVVKNKDAAFVVHDRGSAYSLYVAMDLACNDQSLLFSIGSNTMNRPAECRKVYGRGVVYTLPGESSLLTNAIRRGSRMKVGLLEPGSETIQNEYQFKLMGATDALNVLDSDEVGYMDAALKPFRGMKLDSNADNKLFALLKKRSVSCRSGTYVPGCVVAEDVEVESVEKVNLKNAIARANREVEVELEAVAPPAMAAAKPLVRRRKPVRIDPDPADFAPGYAQVITEQLGSGNQPECKAVVEKIMAVASSNGTPDSRSRQIDLIVGGAPTICF